MKRSSRRYIVNRRLLVVTAVTLAVAAPATYLWYSYQLRQTANAILARAERLEEERDWGRATTYYQQYLLMEPQDTQALVKMAKTFSKLEPSPNRLNRLNSLLYRAVGRAGKRSDLRRMLAENLLELGAFEEAEQEANNVLLEEGDYKPTPDDARAARKVVALSRAARARADGSISIAQATNELISAAKESPGDTRLVDVAANTLREHPIAIELEGSDPAMFADQMMNQLVAANPENVEARLARYRYRARYKLPEADRDLQAALEIEPNNVDALRLSALSRIATEPTDKQRAQAEALLHRAIEAAPNDPRAYLDLTMVLERAGNHKDALKWLEVGRDATDNNLYLGIAYVNALINTDKVAKAEETLQDLGVQSAAVLAGLDGTARAQLENRFRLLRARLDLAQGATHSAIAKLKTILLSTTGSASNQRLPERMEAFRLLAQIHARFGQWDKASEYWGSLAEQAPADIDVVRPAVDAHLRAGNPSAAIQRIDDFSRLAKPSSDLLVQLVQAQLAQQTRRPETERNWTEFEKALEAAQTEAGDRPELVFAKVAQLLAGTGDPEAAVKLLHKAEDKFADRVDFWKNAVRVYQQLGLREDVQRALVKHREVTTSMADHAILEAGLLADQGKYTEAEQLLAHLESSLVNGERRQIERARIAILAAAKDTTGALQRAKQLIDANPDDVELLAMGIDLALEAEDFKTAEAWERKLREFTDNGLDAQYLRARRLLLSYDQLQSPEKQDLSRSIAELRAERPKWYPVVALAARLAQLQGDLRRALLDYQQAVDLGDHRAFTLQQLVSLLYENGRFNEAQEYLSWFISDQPTASYFDSMAVELALKQNRSAAALELAKESVDRFPKDALRRIILANLLLRFGQPQEAIDVLRVAADKFTDDSRVWTALFSALVQAERVEEARQTLAALVASSMLPQGQRHFVAAQGYEILGDVEQAKKQYELAIAQQPQETELRLRFAKLLSNSNPRAAREQYDHVLQQDPVNDEARRELAILLATTGQEADWTRATQLLAAATDQSAGKGNTNDRLRVLLLSRKGRTRAERLINCQAARSILRKLIESDTAETTDLNRLLMAQILEQEAGLSGDQSLLFAARDELRTVVHQGLPTAEKLSRYIEFLLRHARSAAQNPTDESASENPDADSARLKEIFLTDAEAALEDFRRLPSSNDDGVAALGVVLTARLLQVRGRDAEANAYVADFVARRTENSPEPNNQAQQFHMIGKLYSSIGAHADAEKWYRRLTELVPNSYVLVVQSLVAQGKRQEAAEFCLSISEGQPTPDVAAVLANLMTVTDEPFEELPEAQIAIATAVKDSSNNIQLLQSQAVMHASRGQYDEAISTFRRVVEIDPDNALALNNLATLLAEKPNLRAEALEHIQQAIDIAGRQPSLLDTQGTILLKLGDSERAIACLEEATAGGAADARYYLHLSAAYHSAERDDNALRMLNEARAFGLERFVLTDDDRRMLEELDKQLDSIAATLETP